MTIIKKLCVVACLVACPTTVSSGCLVLSVNPAYDDNSIAWDPNLIGHWFNADDRSSIAIEKGEWRSYRIHYEHPIEVGDLTGYLTVVRNERFLDVMPARGQDHGSFLVPVHALLRVRLNGDTLELSPLSYDWFADHMRAGKAVAGLSVAFDQNENALVTSPVDRLRDWLRTQTADGPVFGASATFTRKPVR